MELSISKFPKLARKAKFLDVFYIKIFDKRESVAINYKGVQFSMFINVAFYIEMLLHYRIIKFESLLHSIWLK